jgi:hypothetical protein
VRRTYECVCSWARRTFIFVLFFIFFKVVSRATHIQFVGAVSVEGLDLLFWKKVVLPSLLLPSLLLPSFLALLVQMYKY